MGTNYRFLSNYHLAIWMENKITFFLFEVKEKIQYFSTDRVRDVLFRITFCFKKKFFFYKFFLSQNYNNQNYNDDWIIF